MTAITPALFMFTLAAVLLAGIVGYLLFVRKRGNRHPREGEGQTARTMVAKESEDPS